MTITLEPVTLPDGWQIVALEKEEIVWQCVARHTAKGRIMTIGTSDPHETVRITAEQLKKDVVKP